MNDAEKVRLLIAFVVFNIVIIVYQFFYNWSPMTILKTILGIIIALGCAAGAYFAAKQVT